MRTIEISAFDVAQRFIGVSEVAGPMSNPHVLAMLQLDAKWPQGDDVAWCSAFVNYIAWLLRLPRSKSLAARSWLAIGKPIHMHEAEPAFDVVILKRGDGEQPGPDVLDAPGHVGFFAAREGEQLLVLGGNQANAVNISRYSMARILGLRRLI